MNDGQHEFIDLLCFRGPRSISQTLGGLDDIDIPKSIALHHPSPLAFFSHRGPLLLLLLLLQELSSSSCLYLLAVLEKS